MFECLYMQDAEQTLDNIIICRVFTHEEQIGKHVFLFFKYVNNNISL
jgi:hypothetical protein